MTLGFITTSRADFGIYYPLLKALHAENWPFFVFAGGMHTSAEFGNSVELIEKEFGIPVEEKINSLSGDDTPHGLANSMGATTIAFGNVWERYINKLSLVFTLGDRFEMFAAATSLVPFNIPIAHLHGGETTLGAIDNKFRHALTAISDYHFASTALHAERVKSIVGSDENVFNVGALGIDGLLSTKLLSPAEFSEKFGFDVNDPFVLVTYHPETVDLRNAEFVKELTDALLKLPFKILCTLPNADTQGSIIRKHFLELEKQIPSQFRCYENLGQRGYFTAMKYCTMLIGNTSSGLIEAASFDKPVINVGNRQKGRTCGDNVLHVSNSATAIVEAGNYALNNLVGKKFTNPYGDGTATNKILDILKRTS